MVLAGGIGVSLFAVRQNQDVRSRASSATGTATINITPVTGEIVAGGSLPVTVSVDPAGNIISAIAMRLSFSYSGSISELSANDIQIDSALLATGDWTCPVKTFTAENGKANIDIGCANTSTIGYSSTGVFDLATFSLMASPAAKNATYILSFDPKESIVTKKTDSLDILLTPSSTGTYTITGGSVAETPVTPVVETPPIVVTPKYRCSTYSCIRDDASGIYTASNCNNSCLQPVNPPTTQRSLPSTGSPLLTAVMLLSGVALVIIPLLLL